MFFALEGEHTLGRNESRPGRLLDVRDYCKLHIVAHYVAVLCGARPEGSPFHVLPVGNVGDDSAGERLRREMAEAGMDLRFLHTVANRPTMLSVCFQYPDGSGGNITTARSAAADLSADDLGVLEGPVSEAGGECIALAAPEVPLEARRRLLEIASKHGALRVASFAPAEIAWARESGMLASVDFLAVNEDEAGALLGKEFDGSAEFLEEFAARVVEHNSGMRVLLSAGPLGAWGFEGGGWVRCPVARVQPVSTAGAGDALLGAALAALAAGAPFTSETEERASLADRPLDSALELAVLLAGLSVTSPHTIHPEANLDALMRFGEEHGVRFAENLLAIFG
jgi:sugar/nucleoside kinase (ribokinase family)